jgi:ammonia channel protein AmtB
MKPLPIIFIAVSLLTTGVLKFNSTTLYGIAGSNVTEATNPKLASSSAIVFISKASRLTNAWTNATTLQRILSEHCRIFDYSIEIVR